MNLLTGLAINIFFETGNLVCMISRFTRQVLISVKKWKFILCTMVAIKTLEN